MPLCIHSPRAARQSQFDDCTSSSIMGFHEDKKATEGSNLPGRRVVVITAAGFPIDLLWLLPVGVVLAVLVRMLWEPHHPETTHTRLGEGEHALRVLLLTDLHAGLNQVSIADLLRAVANSGADVLLFAGDACSGRHDASKAVRILSSLGTAATDAGMPAFAVPGNHDLPIDDRSYQSAGVPLLRNRNAVVRSRDGTRWNIAGLDDLRYGTPRFPACQAVADIPAERTVVLSHNPDAVYLVPTGSARYLLSGHFHGGQIWMPFHIEFHVLRHERLVAEGVYRGRFERNGVIGYISRGIGCVVLPFRLGSRPEIAVLDLYAP